MYSNSVRISVFFCLTFAVILGESHPGKDYEAGSAGGRTDDNQNSEFSDSGSEFQGRGTVDPEVADQLEGNGWLDVIPGTPGKDYPNYEKIPETSFSCDGKTVGGYYADIEARCQVFHVCNTGGLKSSFVCPSGSIFNQKYFVCDWWYDFECDDATDLYSLNEKVNRGGTGSGPSGPGRLEESFENPDDYQAHKNRENFDLSLAGTGEGGPGYSRGGNRGYQSDSNDGENGERENDGGKISDKKEEGTDVKAREVTSESKRSGDNFLRQNSGVNYRGRNSNGAPKIYNFRTGNDGSRDRGNGFNENIDSNTTRVPENINNDDNYEMNYERPQSFGERSSAPGGHDHRELSSVNSSEKIIDEISNRYSSRSNDNGYGNTGVVGEGTRSKVVRNRQRNSGGLPGGLGNGYPSPGRSRELPGSDGIAATNVITPGRNTPVYEERDQRSSVVNSGRRTSSGSGTPGGPMEQRFGTESQKIIEDRNDNDKSTVDRQQGIDSYDDRLSKTRKYSDRDYSSLRNDDSNRQRGRNEGKKHADDYLVGIVPGDENRQGQKNFGQSDKPRRYLPIL